jgi:hypothetical protein
MTTTTPDDGRVTERWRYAGRRSNGQNELFHEWQTAEHGPKWWKVGRDLFVVGAYYDASVTWKEEGGAVLHGTPSFSSTAATDEPLTAQWEVQDHSAVVENKKAKREKSARTDKRLIDALAPLEKIAAGLKDPADLDALVAIVTRRLNQAQFRSKDRRRTR